MSACVLLAAGIPAEVIIVLLALIFGGLKLLAQVLKQGRLPQPPRPARPMAGPLQDQIEEFLRRAAERRGPAMPQRQTPAGDVPASAPIEAAEVVDEPVGDRMMQQVQQDMDSSEFTRRTAQLGEEVVAADSEFSQRAQQTFGGEVSRLARRPGKTATAPQAQETMTSDEAPMVESAASTGESLGDLSGLVSDPANIVRAIIVSEILRPVI
jgi:hypothetical protein